MIKPVRVVLASGSPRRQQMLLELGIRFEPFVSDIPEIWKPQDPAGRTAVQLARRKARKYQGKDALVIAMDTIVAIRRKKLGKPENAEEAKIMLEFLSGRTHDVITGCALRWNGRTISGMEKTCVEFRKIMPAEIDWYVETREPFGKAGGYAIQGLGRIFINSIEGCYYNVVGFPLTLFQRMLRRWHLSIFDLQSLPGNG
jgi:nucleoside triphosphate pyrophosphatase